MYRITYFDSLKHICLAHIIITSVYNANGLWPALLCRTYSFPENTFPAPTGITSGRRVSRESYKN